MKIKAIVLPAMLALLAAPALAAHDFPSHANDATARRGSTVDDVLVTPLENAKIKRKETGFFFHRRDSRPPEVQIAEADAAFKAGNLSGACSRYDRLVRSWPYCALAPRAQHNFASLLERRGKYARAFEEYQYLLVFYPENTAAGDVLDHMFAIANWQLGRGKESDAAKSFSAITALAPGWARAPEAYLQAGLAELAEKNYYEAADAFDTLSTGYPDSPLAVTAAEKHALALYALSLKYLEDEAIQRRAINLAVAALKIAPEDSPDRPAIAAALDDLAERRDARAFAIARFYDTRRFPAETRIAAYEDFLRRNPLAPQAEEARRRLGVLRAAQAPAADGPAATDKPASSDTPTQSTGDTPAQSK